MNHETAMLLFTRPPDLVDEADANTTYIGYIRNGDKERCLIIQIWKFGTVTYRMYAKGLATYDNNWALRAELVYEYLKS
jgi:hypothetical protein